MAEVDTGLRRCVLCNVEKLPAGRVLCPLSEPNMGIPHLKFFLCAECQPVALAHATHLDGGEPVVPWSVVYQLGRERWVEGVALDAQRAKLS